MEDFLKMKVVQYPQNELENNLKINLPNHGSVFLLQVEG